jgi:nitrate reductase NapE component
VTDPDPHRTPGAVIATVAAATVVVPLLMVYSFLFIVRGLFVQVEQPDITSSRSGEAVAGFIALAFLVFVLWGMIRLLNGQHRLVFWAGQLIAAGAAAKFLLDSSSGQPEVPAVVLIAALLALLGSVLPVTTRWVRSAGGDRVQTPASRPDPGQLSEDGDLLSHPIKQQG